MHSATPGSQTAHLRLPCLALLHRRSCIPPCSSDDGHARTPGRSPWHSAASAAQHGQPLGGCTDMLGAKVLASGIVDPGDGLNTLC